MKIKAYYFSILFVSFLGCNQTTNSIEKAKEFYDDRDSIEKANLKVLKEQGNNITKAKIDLNDNTFALTADSHKDHRIIGYHKPDTNSIRLILFSVFIDDVENNPFQCKLGAYYDLTNTKGIKIKFLETKNQFVKTLVKDSLGKKYHVYFAKKDINFVEKEKKYPGELVEHGMIEKIENFGYRVYCKSTDAIKDKINSNPSVSSPLEKAGIVINKCRKLISNIKIKNKIEELRSKDGSIFGKHHKDEKLEEISGILNIIKNPKEKGVVGEFEIKTLDGTKVKFESEISSKILQANGKKVKAFYSQIQVKKTVVDSVVVKR